MTTQEVANQLVQYCRTGQNAKAYDELFAPNAVALEPEGAPMQRVEGLPALKDKSQHFQDSIQEVHANEVSDPMVADGHFCVRMMMDATFKGGGRMQFDELCLYKVEHGKITEEQFFYPVRSQT